MMDFPVHDELSRHLKPNVIWNLLICSPDVHWVWIFAILSSHVNIGNGLRFLPRSPEVSGVQRDIKA